MRAILLGLVGMALAGLAFYAYRLISEFASPEGKLKLNTERYLRQKGYRPRRMVKVVRGAFEDAVEWLCEERKHVIVTVADGIPVRHREKEVNDEHH